MIVCWGMSTECELFRCVRYGTAGGIRTGARDADGFAFLVKIGDAVGEIGDGLDARSSVS